MGSYAFTGLKENMAKAKAMSLPVSTKQCVLIAAFLKGKQVKDAKLILERVAALKQAVPYPRFNRDTGHKPGMAAGRYPVKASKEILKLLASVEANAQLKGLNTASLKIVHFCANRAARPLRFGRKSGVKSKRSHVEIIVEEVPKTSTKEKKV
ncbi:MAG: 50S ribosomal protein L22 [Nanoarchaeota archaeon]